MAIKSSTFGGIKLSGGAAKAFKKQFVDNSQPNPVAQKAYQEGKKLFKEFERKGYITIKIK